MNTDPIEKQVLEKRKIRELYLKTEEKASKTYQKSVDKAKKLYTQKLEQIEKSNAFSSFRQS